MNAIRAATFQANGRGYRADAHPIVVICIDGCADEYLSAALARRLMPNLERMSVQGYRGLVRGALPSFTNVNNCAMVTGTPPSLTGIGGNYMLVRETGREQMTNSPEFLRNETILAAAAGAGRRVAMVTAKDKLRALLAKDLDGIAFSAEKADEVTRQTDGVDGLQAAVGAAPSIYSGQASLYVLRAGVWLIGSGQADFLYLTTTDYMQHKFAPEAAPMLEFYAELDRYLGELLELGAVVGITADHGMNAKCDAAGQPRVLMLESELNRQFGDGFRVICPITDPYVVHHGALGSAVTVYLPPGQDGDRVSRWLLEQPAVTEVHDRASAARKLELPADRIGDLFVLSGRDWVLGRTEAYHDLAQLEGTLRSHGGRYEEMVPLVLSHPLAPEYRRKAAGDPRNFDVFDFVCNGTAVTSGSHRHD